MNLISSLFKKNPIVYIPFFIFLFSFLLRLSLISRGPYHGDSLDLVFQAQRSMETFELQKHTPLGFPLMVLLSGLFIKGAEFLDIRDPFMAINFLSVVFSSLAVLALYFFVRKMFDERTAFFSSVLFSVAPMFLGVSVYGKNHAPSLYFLLQGLYFLARYFDGQRQKDIFLSGLFIGLMGAVRLDVALMLLPLSFILYVGINNERNYRRIAMFWMIVVMVMAVFYFPYLMKPQGLSVQEYGRYIKSDLFKNYLGLLSPRLIVAFKFFVQSLTIGGLAGSAIGLIMIVRQRKHVGWFLILWVCSILLFYGNLHMTVTSRYFTVALPPLLIGLGYLFGELQKSNKKIKLLAYALFIVLTVRLFLDIYPVLKVRHDHALLPRYAQWVGRMTETNAIIIVADEGGFMDYFGNRGILVRPTGGPSNTYHAGHEELGEFKAKVDRLLAQHTPVYISDAALYAYNKDNYFVNFMNDHYKGDKVGTCLYEDWHSGELELQIFPFNLYRISLPER